MIILANEDVPDFTDIIIENVIAKVDREGMTPDNQKLMETFKDIFGGSKCLKQ